MDLRTDTSILRAALAVAVAVLCLGVGPLGAQGASDSVELRELRAALKVAQDQVAAERERADALDSQRRALVASLAEAVRVSEEQVVAARENQLQLQAFGVDLFTKDENSLEQRLLKAVRDLDIAQQEIDRRSASLRRLGEVFLKVLKGAEGLSDAQKAEAEAVLAEANASLSAPGDDRVSADLAGSRVVSFDGAIGLVVFDAGRESGLRVGTPITIHRGERPLYSALVVDVRDSIAGAVLQDRLAGVEEVEVGDAIRLLPDQRTL